MKRNFFLLSIMFLFVSCAQYTNEDVCDFAANEINKLLVEYDDIVLCKFIEQNYFYDSSMEEYKSMDCVINKYVVVSSTEHKFRRGDVFLIYGLIDDTSSIQKRHDVDFSDDFIFIVDVDAMKIDNQSAEKFISQTYSDESFNKFSRNVFLIESHRPSLELTHRFTGGDKLCLIEYFEKICTGKMKK